MKSDLFDKKLTCSQIHLARDFLEGAMTVSAKTVARHFSV